MPFCLAGYSIARCQLHACRTVCASTALESWPHCCSATEALLVASGGTLTTLLGHPIEHSALVPTANRLGVVATARSYANPAVGGRTHRQLCNTFVQELNAELVALFRIGSTSVAGGGGQQALDILRDISGQPLTPTELSQAVGCAPSAVEAISCPESGCVVRYKQSIAGRIFLHAVACLDGEQTVAPPPSVFYKRAVLRELPYALQKAEQHPFKIVRDVKSNCVEATFLQSALLAQFCDAAGGRVQVARPYRVEQRAFKLNPIDSRFGRLVHRVQSPTSHI